MSEQTIKILIVDDNERTRDKLIEQLRFDGMTVVGESNYGAAAYTWAEQLDVDVVMVSIEEPMARALRTAESLAVGARSWPVLGVTTQTDRETMRKAMLAGVRDHLVLPVSDEELHQTILNIHRVEQSRRTAVAQGQTAGRVGTIVAIVGVKGGIGKSTVSTNTAIALAEQSNQQIALCDLDLQFGDDAVMLDVLPSRTIEDAAAELNWSNPQLIQGYLTDHGSRVKLLAAPATPEGAETLSEDQVGKVLETLAATHDYVVVDTSAQIDAISMRAMDLATIVLLVVIPEVPCVRRTKAALALMQEWGYSRDKVKLVVNRARKKGEVSIDEIEKVLQYPVYAQIPEDPKAVKGISIGAPVVLSAPKSEAGKAFSDLGRALIGAPVVSKRRSLLKRKAAEPARPAVAPAPAPYVQPWATASNGKAAELPKPRQNSPATSTNGEHDEFDAAQTAGSTNNLAPFELQLESRTNGHAKDLVYDLTQRSPYRDEAVD
jgi:pilus assembly protein CpaE